MPDSELFEEGPKPQGDKAAPSQPPTDDPAGTTSEPAVRKRTRMFDDPVVRTMTWIAYGLVFIYAVTLIGAFGLGVLGRAKTPRTAPERALAVTEARYNSGDRSAAGVAEYIDALIAVNQYSKAQSVINDSAKIDQSRAAEITLEQARLYFAKGDFKDAIKSATEARKIIKTKYDAEIKKNASGNESAAYGLPGNYGEAAIVIARSSEKTGDWKAAVAAYNDYLTQDATASDILIARGYAKIETGDKAGAKADFQKALKFIPKDESALAGLKKIGAAQ